MTPVEALKLLTFIRQIDNKIGESDQARAHLWADLLDDVPFEGAKLAVKAYYREDDSADTILPGHIRAGVKKIIEAHAASLRRAVALENDWETHARPWRMVGDPAYRDLVARTPNDEYRAARAMYVKRPAHDPLSNSKQIKYRGLSKRDEKPLGPTLRLVSGEIKRRAGDAA